MSNLGESKDKIHSNYKLLNNIINNEVDEKKQTEEPIQNKELIKSITENQGAKSNNFIQEEDKMDKSSLKNNPSFNKISVLNQKNNITNPKAEILSKNKIEIEKNLLNDNKEENFNADENINDLSKKIVLIKKEYKGTKSKAIVYIPIADYKIEPIINDSKYNIFFILAIPKMFIDRIKFSVHEKQTNYNEEYIQSYYISYEIHFIGEKNENKFNQDLNYIIVQVPVRKDTKKLIINMEYNKEDEYYIGEIKSQIQTNNYFYQKNVFYALKDYDLTDNQIFSIYLDFFFDEKNNEDENLKSDLIFSLIHNIKRNYSYIELSGDIILKFINYSLLYGFVPENLEKIKVIKNKLPIDKSYYLKYENFNDYELSKGEKLELLSLLIQIYVKNDKDYLLSLLKGDLGSKYFGSILDLLNTRRLYEYDLIFPNDKDNIFLQDNLLEFCETLVDINSVLSLSIGLTKHLTYLNERYEQIYNIVTSKKYRSYLIETTRMDNNDKYQDIYKLLLNLIKKSKNSKYKIIDFCQIFNELINYFYNGTLEEFENLNELLNILHDESLLSSELVVKYFRYLHRKGVILIKTKALNINQIIDFLFNHDIFYYNKKYNMHSDPTIFNSIPITDKEENYEVNIKEMKKCKIWELFTNEEKKIQMYEAFLDQINRITELRFIFELFPEDEINKNFSRLIAVKVNEISGTISIEKQENYNMIFEIFKKYLKCLEKHNLTIFIPKVNYEFNFKLYEYILKDNQLKKIVNKIKDEIIYFFLEFNINHNGIEEDIVNILLLTYETDLCIEMLDNMEKLVIKKSDFYKKEETKKYNLFKLIFQKCVNIINKKKGKYVKETLKIREEIYKELYDLKVAFDKINNHFDEENSFFPRILLICNKEEKQAIKLNDKLKDGIQI